MQNKTLAILTSCFLVGLTVAPAHATPVLWELDGLVTNDAPATGSFTWDADSAIFSNVSLVTGAASPTGGLTFTQFLGESIGFTGIMFGQAGATDATDSTVLILRNVSVSDLTNSGGVLSQPTYLVSGGAAEATCSDVNCGSTVAVSNWRTGSMLTGTPTSVPLPTTLALLGIGFAGYGFQRRKQINAT
ncbi:MAG: PEP-CTERM sorting domain-containing protein [Chromatiaceae bacterium]|nr:PEP-CTERM sorting domain-containing protein [Chromatiaceae bacterium]